MLKEILEKKDYLPILKMNDGTPVTKENWEERRGELRALLEKYSYGHTPNVEATVTGEKYDTLNIIGGGSKNDFLNELTKKKTGKRIITGPAEGTAIGNLIVQMTADGVFASIKDGRAAIKRSFDINEV